MVKVVSSADELERIRRIQDNYKTIKERVARAAYRVGRLPESVRVMAVTKSFPREDVVAVVGAGLELLGENRVQEASGKHADGSRSYELHLIGHLQRNKARDAAKLFDTVQSIDSLQIAVALEHRCSVLNRTLAILLQMNASGESTKTGFPTEDGLLEAAAEIVASCPHLLLKGVMTVGAHSDDEKVVRNSFRRLRLVHEKLILDHPGADTLSMGMSQDFELAIEEGATLIRLGSVLLGSRLEP